MRRLIFGIVLMFASVAQATDVSLIISESFVNNLGGSWGDVHIITDQQTEWTVMNSAFTSAPGYDKYLSASFTIPGLSDTFWFRFEKQTGGYEYLMHDNMAAHAAANPTSITVTATANLAGVMQELKAQRSPGGSGTTTHSSTYNLASIPAHLATVAHQAATVTIANAIDLGEFLIDAAGIMLYGMLAFFSLSLGVHFAWMGYWKILKAADYVPPSPLERSISGLRRLRVALYLHGRSRRSARSGQRKMASSSSRFKSRGGRSSNRAGKVHVRKAQWKGRPRNRGRF